MRKWKAIMGLLSATAIMSWFMTRPDIAAILPNQIVVLVAAGMLGWLLGEAATRRDE